MVNPPPSFLKLFAIKLLRVKLGLTYLSSIP